MGLELNDFPVRKNKTKKNVWDVKGYITFGFLQKGATVFPIAELFG